MALLVLICIPWALALKAPFIQIDDPTYVTNNPQVLAGLQPQAVAEAFTTNRGDMWIPMTWLSLGADVSLAGVSGQANVSANDEHLELPASFSRLAVVMHTTNVLLHIANVLLLYGFLRLATRSGWRSALVAALFAVHPLRVESVAWITERKDVLSGFFGLLALIMYVKYVRKGGLLRFAGVCLLFALSLMAKPMLVTFPFLLLLLDYWPMQRWRRPGPSNASGESPPRAAPRKAAQPAPEDRAATRTLLLEKLPLLAISAAVSILTLWITISKKSLVPRELNPLGRRIATAIEGYGLYLRDTFYFGKLTVYYPVHPPEIPVVAACGAILLAVTALAVLLVRKKPLVGKPVLVGWLWYLGTLVPTSGLFQMGGQQRADRFTYFPSIGLFILLVWIWPDSWFAAPIRRKIAGFASAAVVLILVVCTSMRIMLWRNPVALYLDAIEHTEHNAYMEGVLASAKENLGLQTEAEFWYRRAIADAPNVDRFHHNLATVLARQGRLREAAAEFSKALQQQPGNPVYQRNYAWAMQKLSESAPASAP
jgi:hypothetical protein